MAHAYETGHPLYEMTSEKWRKLTERERDAIRDMSDCNAQLLPYRGKRVRVTPKRQYGLSSFIVGISTGWAPILLAMRNDPRSHGSSDVIRADERFTSIAVIDR